MHFTAPPLPALGHAITSHLTERRLLVTNIELTLPDVAAPLKGFTMAQLSDLHAGRNRWRPVHLNRAMAVIREAHPDVLVVTGDFLYRDPPLAELDDVFGALQSLPMPRIVMLGNHDYYAGAEKACALSRALEAGGCRVLVNEREDVKRNGATVSFVALSDDALAANFEGGVARLMSSPHPRVALIHEPELAERMPSAAADLVLAGHTHGGQIDLPGLTHWIVRHFCGSNYIAGEYLVNGNRMYVNRGLGCVGVPFRFRAAPELTLVRLR
ncbi:MAG: metallophosphoesterase [Chloroflexota bacterium]